MTFSGPRPEPMRRGLDDAAIGLVRAVQIQIGARQAVALEHPERGLLVLLHGKLEDRLSVLLHVVQALLDGLLRRRPPAAAGRHAQRRAARPVDLV